MNQYRIVKIVEAQRCGWSGEASGKIVTYYQPQRKGWFFWHSLGYAETLKIAQSIVDAEAHGRKEQIVK